MFFFAVADPRRITSADTRVLEIADPDSTGYFGVEPTPTESGFRAKAYKHQISPPCRTPRDAARYEAAWWKEAYGDQWPSVFRARKASGWRILYDRRGGGYRLMVNVIPTPGLFRFHPPGPWYLVPASKGVRRYVVASPGPSREPDYLTRGEAMSAYRAWLWQTFGIFGEYAGLYVRRMAMPPVNDDDEEQVPARLRN